jgi:hypothetical protein
MSTINLMHPLPAYGVSTNTQPTLIVEQYTQQLAQTMNGLANQFNYVVGQTLFGGTSAPQGYSFSATAAAGPYAINWGNVTALTGGYGYYEPVKPKEKQWSNCR